MVKKTKIEEDLCPVCDGDLYYDEYFTQRVGVLDENDEVEGWMCPHCRSLFDLEQNLTYIRMQKTKVGKA